MINLYQYQKDYLEAMPARHIMAADTGTGKTFMALEQFKRHGGFRPLLILAPAAKVRTGDWEREIEEYFGKDHNVKYYIFSYEKFSRQPSAKKFAEGDRPVWHSFAPKFGGVEAAIIADECHKMKSWKSNIGKAMYLCAKDANFFIGLSATPLPNGWIDFANYSKIWGFTKGITDFKNKYCEIVNYKGFPEIKNYKRTDDLLAQWNLISTPLDKSQANDLPARTFIGVNFDKPATYKKMMKTRVDEDGELLDSAPKLAHALRQTLTPGKLDYLSELIEGTNENMVIFYTYVSERDAILDLLAKKHKEKVVFRQDGSAHELPRKEIWDSIGNSVTVAQYQSGSTGVEMTYATTVIYFSPTYSYADYVQSIGRVHRNGQTKKTTYFNLRTTNTIEEAVYKVLQAKQDFQVSQWAEEQ